MSYSLYYVGPRLGLLGHTVLKGGRDMGDAAKNGIGGIVTIWDDYTNGCLNCIELGRDYLLHHLIQLLDYMGGRDIKGKKIDRGAGVCTHDLSLGATCVIDYGQYKHCHMAFQDHIPRG